MSKPKPEVGMRLYSLPIANAARRGNLTLTPVTVTSLGRKYFKATTDYQHERTYRFSDWVENGDWCLVSSKLYATEQEWEDEKEADALRREIANVFSHYSNGGAKIPLNALRQIRALINTEPQP